MDSSDNTSLLHSLYPSLLNLKEKLLMKVPRNITEVSQYDDVLEDLPIRQTYTSTKRYSAISAEMLADQFDIGIERAKATLRATVHIGTRSSILPISKRYRADMQHTAKKINGRFATYTIWAKSLSLRGNVAIPIYSHKCGFNAS